MSIHKATSRCVTTRLYYHYRAALVACGHNGNLALIVVKRNAFGVSSVNERRALNSNHSRQTLFAANRLCTQAGDVRVDCSTGSRYRYPVYPTFACVNDDVAARLMALDRPARELIRIILTRVPVFTIRLGFHVHVAESTDLFHGF